MQPARTYSCALQTDDPLASAKYSGTALQYLCVTELAKLGGHANCRVEREPLGGVCNGERRLISLGASSLPNGPNSAASKPLEPGTGPVPAPTAPSIGVTLAEPGTKPPPATVEELVNEQAKASKADLKAAGKSFNASVKKSWECLTSLFQDC